MKIFRKLAAALTAAAIAAAGIVLPKASEQNVIKADAASTMTAKQIVTDMGVGWNLGNTFDAADCSWLSNELDYESAWCKVKTTKKLIDTVADLGFTSIRIPVSWHNHVDGSNKISTAWMNRVKEVVDYAIDDGLYVIINIHHDNTIQSGKNFFYPSSKYLSTSKSYISTIWKQIATKFKSYDQHLIFETMNEPRLIGDTNEWWFTKASPQTNVKDAISCINTLNQTAVDAIRAVGGNNKTRLIMCPGYDASVDGATVSTYKLPTDSSNMLAVSIHAYSPYDFAMNAGGGTSTYSDNMKSQLKNMFSTINNTFVKKGTAVVIGEFGAFDKNNSAQRVDWVKDYMKQATDLNIPCLLWDNNAFRTGSDYNEKLGFINRTTNKVADQNFCNALFTYAKIGSVKDATVSLKYDSYTYTGSAVKPDNRSGSNDFTVKYNGKTLTKGTDYTVSYKNNTNVGIATATINGKGKYDGSKSITFIIKPKQNSITALKPYIASDKAGMIVYWNKNSSATGYQVRYSKSADFSTSNSTTITDLNKNYVYLTSKPEAGETWYVKVRSFYTKDGKTTSTRYGNYSAVSSIKIENNITKLGSVLPYSSYTYTGSAIKPVEIVNGTTKLVEGTDYTVSYSNNTKVGVATAKITAKGKYTGSVTKTFIIKPAKNKITAISTSTGAFKITWEKGTTGTIGYQVLYSRNKAALSDALVETPNADAKKYVHSYTSTDLSDLSENFSTYPKSGETWYVKVRSFYTKDGKTSSARYGNYSDIKSITVK